MRDRPVIVLSERRGQHGFRATAGDIGHSVPIHRSDHAGCSTWPGWQPTARFVFGVGWGWNREEFDDHTGVLTPPGPADGLRRALERADELAVRRVLIQIDEETMADAEAVLDRAAVVIPER